jgi:hypothetical protein
VKVLWYVNRKYGLEIDGWIFKSSLELALSEPENKDQPLGYLDALEEDCDTEDLNFVLEVQCLAVMNEKHELGSELWEGLILVRTRPEQHECYRRIGTFYLNRNGKHRDPFEHVKQRVLTIY